MLLASPALALRTRARTHAGGGSLLAELPTRLQKELALAVPVGVRAKVAVPPSASERWFGSWTGGSILASLGSFHQMWFSRHEYDELGTSILLRKCP